MFVCTESLILVSNPTSRRFICWLLFQTFIYIYIQWNLSNPTHQGTREMCRIVQDVGILRFYFNKQKYFGTINFCQMSQDVGNFRCRIAQVPLYICYSMLTSVYLSSHRYYIYICVIACLLLSTCPVTDIIYIYIYIYICHSMFTSVYLSSHRYYICVIACLLQSTCPVTDIIYMS